jgi:multicomponent Na+:H+ antiporter subunit F
MIFNQENLDRSYEFLFMGSLFILSVLLIFCIYRAAKGPRIADRLLSINMCGTMTITAICILAVLLGEDYLVDIGLLYAMISFLAVVVLSRIYRGVYLARKDAKNAGPLEAMEYMDQEDSHVS